MLEGIADDKPRSAFALSRPEMWIAVRVHHEVAADGVNRQGKKVSGTDDVDVGTGTELRRQRLELRDERAQPVREPKRFDLEASQLSPSSPGTHRNQAPYQETCPA
jgi:hypothetical protein